MTLTVCVGASGSGKTTFLEDVHKSHKCTYIRQYHKMRPYITVTKIPNFDPTALPYWEIYQKEGKDQTIKVGGTMAGEFTPGLSGGQRKLLLFELIYQRTRDQKNLLLVFDEPFAGVTDDFVPFIVERLNEMRQQHNILLVTNDHVHTLTAMADNTVTVSALDRSTVVMNQDRKLVRDKAILAFSLGKEYRYKATHADLKFFFDVEVAYNKALFGIFLFSTFCYLLFLATFWDSNFETSAALVLVAGDIVSFFCANPYLLSLVDWRNAMLEEAEALMHSSKGLNKALKTGLSAMVLLLLSLAQFGMINAVMDGLESSRYWVAMLFDTFSSTIPLIALGLYTRLPFQAVEIIGSLPFLLMIFLSTAFSPGAGVPVLKELRYLFTRFYFWCMVPIVQDSMEGCPSEAVNFALLLITGVAGIIVGFVFYAITKFRSNRESEKKAANLRKTLADDEFRQLQLTLYGHKALEDYGEESQAAV